MKRKRLGDILLEANMINQEQLQQALQSQRQTGLKLGDQLIEMGLITQQQLIEVLGLQLGIAYVHLYEYTIDQQLLNIISEELAQRYQVLPLKRQGNVLTVAMADPLDYFAIDDLRLSTGFQIEPVMANKQELEKAINRYYGMQKSIEQMLDEVSSTAAEELMLGSEREEDSPAARMVQQLIGQAVAQEASDIHIDPLEDETLIRYRIDGILRTERTLPKSMHGVLVSRLKILARLDIAAKRLPQDGRFQLDLNGLRIDIRVSTLPTVQGEKVVLRLLDLRRAFLTIDQLGFSNQHAAAFKQIIGKPHGIVLVTGPTGSGKTTTLYAVLHALNTDKVNIVTVEDPVEYQIRGINQVQVNPAIGLTFSAGLRAMLRQDPNVIMVGEIRDMETAQIALRAALTGHLVLSTLHTNDALSSITRLVEMGIEPYLVSSTLVGVVAQRLVRRVCPTCATRMTVDNEQRALFEQRGLSTDKLVKGTGCPACYQTGYRGRLAIHEVLRMDSTLKRLVSRKAPLEQYHSHLAKQGFVQLVDDGLAKAAQGFTTVEEVWRVAIDEPLAKGD